MSMKIVVNDASQSALSPRDAVASAVRPRGADEAFIAAT